MDEQQISETSSGDITIEQLQAELSEALKQAEENLSGWKRTQADLENYRKKKEAEGTELVQFGKQAGFVQILPVLDSLEMAILHAPEIEDEKYKNFKNGLDAIVKQIDAAIVAMGISKIDAVGKKFDPHLHEAIKEVNGEEDGLVVEQYQTGYTLQGKLLRPAQVSISKKNI
ncbi:MAG: molecular chaperone GrpE [Candidatus Doudnabacteria bacterium Gr01-1014_77]|uniref:Protein GrpE n=1 Tax=Candidatus Doudnabacteria bacterium Gr01-1014_77 TaxID=2017133 RepID=A0A554JDD2_9BACT|nr:MAG: molecular chaperone GrpE [Candidatus Doudnabacteria bacterium Gr01-1014_77]